MSHGVSSAGRIAKNTALLYFRIFVSFGVSLFATPIVLGQLGVNDYGTFHVVGGLVGLLSFLPGAMAMATQRFFAEALGKNDSRRLSESFSVNLVLYVAIAIFALVLLQTAGLYFLSHYVKVEANRLPVALQIYQFSVAGFVISLLAAPFMAMIIAHEHMHVYARMAFVDATLRVATASALMVTPADKLLTFGFLSAASSIITVLLYVVICLRAYPACRLTSLAWNGVLAFQVLGFTGWSLFGQLTTVCRTQAITILLNQYFNPATVAARAIATNVAHTAGMLSQNLNTSLYGPIIKAYASGQRRRMFELLCHGSKVTFFLMWLLALPLMVEMPGILTLWLKQPPESAAIFARLGLVEALILAMSLPLLTAARAPGQMALYESTLGSVQVLILVGAWAGLQLGAPAYSVFIAAIVGNLVMFMTRLLLLRRSIQLPLGEFMQRVTLPILGVVVVTTLVAIAVRQLLLVLEVPVLLRAAALASLTAGLIYMVGLDRSVRSRISRAILARAKFALLS